MDPSDASAGLFLLVFGLSGIILYLLIIFSMIRMSNEIVGFRFLISQSITDILLLVQFGIWPGLVIITQDELLPANIRWHVHVYLNFTWWAMVYHYTIVAWSRLAAIQWPNWFRTQSMGTSILICFLPWFLGLLQSMVEHQFSWFEPLWYSPEQYGMTSNWALYDTNGTDAYYMFCNTTLMILPFPFYFIAIFALWKRQRQRRLEIRSRYTHSYSSAAFAAQRQLSIETRLLAPCMINTVLFVIGQIFITQLAQHGRWWNWAVMVVFACNSYVNPLLYLCFSSVIRKGVMADCGKRISFSAIYDYELKSSSNEQRSSLIRINKDSTVTSNLNRIA